MLTALLVVTHATNYMLTVHAMMRPPLMSTDRKIASFANQSLDYTNRKHWIALSCVDGCR
jgi:hypothetical protein